MVRVRGHELVAELTAASACAELDEQAQQRKGKLVPCVTGVYDVVFALLLELGGCITTCTYVIIGVIPAVAYSVVACGQGTMNQLNVNCNSQRATTFHNSQQQ